MNIYFMRFAAMVAFLLPSIGLGQSITGLSDLYFNAGTNKVEAWGQMWADYSTSYYYDLEMGTTLDANGVWTGGDWQCCQQSYAGTWIEVNVQPAAEYTVTSSHSANIYFTVYELGWYCTWDCGSWGDIFGYSWSGCLPEDPGYACEPPFWSVTGWGRIIPEVALATAQVFLGQTQKKTTPLGPATPTYPIIMRAFIPFPYVSAPPPTAFCTGSDQLAHGLIYEGDNRTYQPFTAGGTLRSEYRLMSIVTAHLGQGLQTANHFAGRSNKFALPVPTDSNGGISLSAYDYVFDDCYLRTATAVAGTENMHHASNVTSQYGLSVHLWGGANNPLHLPSPDIDWDYTINMVAVPGYPAGYTISYTHDCFPAHEVWLNHQLPQIHGYTPPFSNVVDIGLCLLRISAPVVGYGYGTIN